jgi:phosphatidylserine decarboxylase
MESVPQTQQVKYRIGKWLPSDKEFLNSWISMKIKQAQSKNLKMHDSVKALRDAIYADPILYMSFTSMYDEIPQGYHEPVKDFETMLLLVNQILNEAPCFSMIENQIGLVGFPINAILDWAMGTKGGYLAFTHPVVNQKLRIILNEWKSYLSSSASQYVLVDGSIEQPQSDYPNPLGWFSSEALKAMAAMDPLRGIGQNPHEAKANFIYNFKCDPTKPHYGFKNWDDFFTREFNPGVRTISAADQHPDVIVNACESAPYNYTNNTKTRDKFCLSSIFMCKNISPMEQSRRWNDYCHRKYPRDILFRSSCSGI